ncbi:unnamed protein product [Rhizophagus irregularis]|nr:unnamed protein product [Rhizophagus irregularis]
MHRLGRRSRLLDQRRILLRQIVDLLYGLVDFVDAHGLRFAGPRNTLDQRADTGHAQHQFFHRFAGLVHQCAAVVDLAHRRLDQRFHFTGRRGAALRQVAHFGGDDRKAAALFAGTGRFHGSIQRQDIGLERDAVDHADDVDDAARRLVDFAHGVGDAANDVAAAAGNFRRFGCQRIGFLGVEGVAADGVGQQDHRCHGLLQRARLRFGTGRQVLVAAGDFLAGMRNFLGTRTDAADDADEAVPHIAQRDHQRANFIFRCVRQFGRQVAGGNGFSELRCVFEWLDDAAGDAVAEDRTEQHGKDGNRVHHRARRGADDVDLLAGDDQLAFDAVDDGVEFGDDAAAQRAAVFDQELAECFLRARSEKFPWLRQGARHFLQIAVGDIEILRPAQYGGELGQAVYDDGRLLVQHIQFALGVFFLFVDVGIAGSDPGLVERFAQFVQRRELGRTDEAFRIHHRRRFSHAIDGEGRQRQRQDNKCAKGEGETGADFECAGHGRWKWLVGIQQ